MKFQPPILFAGQPVSLVESSKDDGHMSFNKISDEETTANINTFLHSLSWPVKQTAFIKVTYANDRTYDLIQPISETENSGPAMSEKAKFAADALVTSRPGVALLLPTADCYPVTLFDPKRKVLALAHMGWHSTHAHLLQKLANKLANDFGSNPKDLLCYFGPGIPAKDYVYDDPMQLTLPGWKPYLYQIEGGYQIDLLGYNRDQLLKAGILPKNIEISPRNTVDNIELESHYMHTKQGLPAARRYLTAVMMA